MTNLVTRLRTEGDTSAVPYANDPDLLREAADEIERLRAALKRLEGALIESEDFVFAAMATEALRGANEPSER